MEHNVCTGISNVRYFSPRLLAALTGILSSPLTVIEAPMGYGKTVAVREFLRRENLAVIWVSVLDSPDGAFWRSLCRELERLPETAETARALRSLGPPFAPDDAARRDAALELLESLDFARPTVLVVDDVHLLASAPSCVRFFQILARQAMSNLHIVLTTRHFQTDDALLADLKGELARLGPALLAFSEEDIRAYCALCGLKISPDQIRALHGATGGWVSGVYLHCRHYAQHGAFSLPAFARSFTLPSPQSSSLSSPQYSENELPPDMAALLEEQLYRPLSPDVRDMLFALCPLEQFTLPQADFCCGTDTRAALEALVRQNSFVRRREGSGVYTVHAIFRSLLLRLFRALPREQRQAVHRRCGDWFAAEDEFIPAMEHYHAARDFERALSVMERDMARHLVTESAAFFARLFQDCPEEVLSRHPRAAFKHALAALSASDFPAFADRCRWLARYCAALDEAHPATPVLRGELEMLLALAEYNDIAAMSVRHRRAWELLGRPTGLYPPESTWSMGCPSVLFMFHRESGNIREEVRLMRECMPHYYKAAAWHGAGGELLFEAEALYMAGDFTEALRLCRQAETVAALHGQLCNTLCALFLRARLALARKNTSTACAAVREMRDLITKKQDYFCCTRRRSARRASPASSGVRMKSPRGCTRAGVNAYTPSPRAISGWRRVALCCWPGMPPPCSACSTPCCKPLSSTSTACSSSTPISSWPPPMPCSTRGKRRLSLCAPLWTRPCRTMCSCLLWKTPILSCRCCSRRKRRAMKTACGAFWPWRNRGCAIWDCPEHALRKFRSVCPSNSMRSRGSPPRDAPARRSHAAWASASTPSKRT